jgi:dipeptidyl aminopeptidase/acylaminoacyl peptidase
MVNPQEVAAIGESAGGNLAELLGTTGASAPSGLSDQVEAVVSFYGPSDLSALVTQGALGGPAAEEYLGGSPEQIPASYQAASPIAHVTSRTAPMLLLHGTADTVVPIAQSEEMATALSGAGVGNQLIAVPGAAHGFEFTAQGRALIGRIADFLQSTLESA